MRSTPPPPPLMNLPPRPPPESAHAHLGGGRVLKARPPLLRQCAQQRTLRDQRTSANPHSSPPTHNSRNHGGSGGSLGRTAHHRLVHLSRAAAGVQVLPAEAGIHRVPDRAAGAGGAQAASPQLRPQLPALGGRIIRCSCASPPAWEPVPRRNGGSPVLPRQRSTCQGQ